MAQSQKLRTAMRSLETSADETVPAAPAVPVEGMRVQAVSASATNGGIAEFTVSNPEENSAHLCPERAHPWSNQPHVLQRLESHRHADNSSFEAVVNNFSRVAEVAEGSDNIWTNDWWNTSFTAAGYDELSVLEPMMPFRETWEGLQ
jgi:hypothetical protein